MASTTAEGAAPMAPRIILVSTNEMAAILRVSAQTVDKLRKVGAITAARVGRQWRFDPDLVVAELTTPAGAPTPDDWRAKVAAAKEAAND